MSTTKDDVETVLPEHMARALRLWEVLADEASHETRVRLFGQIQGLGLLGRRLGITDLRARTCAAYAGFYAGTAEDRTHAEAVLRQLDAWAAQLHEVLLNDDATEEEGDDGQHGDGR